MQRTTILALSVLLAGAAALLPLACTQNFDMFASSAGTGASGGSASGTDSGSPTGSSSHASSSGSKSSSSTSSSSGSGGCTSVADCDDTNACTTDACTKGKCTHTPIASGNVPGYIDNVKDCKTKACKSGVETTVADDTDVPNNANPCVTVSCSMQQVVTTPITLGQSCGTMQTCDGNGNCVGCNSASDCQAAPTCQSVACTNHMCVDSNQQPRTPCGAGGAQLCDGAGNCVQCLQGSDCSSGNCQNNSCGLAPLGHQCTMSNQCSSNHCATGVCCDHTCNNLCMACTNALTGNSDGTCDNVQSGSPAPNNQCTAAPPCGHDGNCDGNGACEEVSPGTACGMPTCMNASLTLAGTCDGNGNCGTATPTNCAPYACNTQGNACRTSCFGGSGTNDCSTGNYCTGSGPTGTCVPQLAMGATCTASYECTNGMCLLVDAGVMNCN